MEPTEKFDFLSTIPGALIAWGLPIAAMILAIGVPHPVKTWIWVGALVWMGSACLWNARRCKRRHCFWTGPFFLAMTLAVLAHGYGLVDLGSQGWRWLGAAIGLGAWGITAITEREGKYH
ncbi:hypothetical protein [Hoeflea sp. EC-HK425]|uniref:hypothetical protein n=1 Tax=Hoeflea sp. EC-HK425 TaxID=2038388 RepID=UPI00125F592C|nr:hypothetical protein [Hoeflea sp. EC-HK425]